jgi:type II secretory pathway pseudopilin PulG
MARSFPSAALLLPVSFRSRTFVGSLRIPAWKGDFQRISRGSAPAAFTLIELLVVIGMMTAMMTLAIPAFNAIGNGNESTKAAYDIAGTLEQARAYAMAHNTYVWVGFVEENAAKASPSTPVSTTSDPGGRVVISVVASAGIQRHPGGQFQQPDEAGADQQPHQTGKRPHGEPERRPFGDRQPK